MVAKIEYWGLTVTVKYNAETKNYDQTLSINDKVVSTLSTCESDSICTFRFPADFIKASGKANGFYMQTECQGTHKGIVAAHCKLRDKIHITHILT